jgi:hypothetical protein
MNYLRKIICSALILMTLTAIPITTSAKIKAKNDFVGIEKTIKFDRGAVSAKFNGQIKVGTAHWYHVRARAGQQMSVILKGGEKSSLTIFSRKSGILEGADDVRRTQINLPETGDYLIEIGTDANETYTLEVTIK